MSSGEPVEQEDFPSMLFSPHGSMGRTAYLVATFVSLILFALCDFMIDGLANLLSVVSEAATGEPSVAIAVGDVLQGVVTVAGLYVSTVLDIKRLRDMGFPYWPAFVILVMSMLQSALASSADQMPVEALLVWAALALVLAAATACLLLWPSRRPAGLDRNVSVLHPET